MLMFDSPARIDTNLDSRSISFENPRGERGAGGTTANGRKGSPNKWISPGEKLCWPTLKDQAVFGIFG